MEYHMRSHFYVFPETHVVAYGITVTVFSRHNIAILSRKGIVCKCATIAPSMNAQPKKIHLNKHGTPVIGYLTAPTAREIPFHTARVFWTYFTPERITRGRHAHTRTSIVLFALTGKIIVTTETTSGIKKTFILDKPNVGLLIPPMVWHTQRYSHTAIQLALASHPYREREYIRDYKIFKAYRKNTKR